MLNRIVLAAGLVLALAAGAGAVPPEAQRAPAEPSPAVSAAPSRQTAPTAEDLQRRLDQQERKIVQLEAKVGVPSTLKGWTWFVIGFVGEFVFFLRFVVQWWASERKKRTVVPMAFWYLSLIGTALVLAYAVFLISPVFILAYSLNIFIYVRNVIIARRQPAAAMVMEKEAE